jgi:hypothetical protein
MYYDCGRAVKHSFAYIEAQRQGSPGAGTRSGPAIRVQPFVGWLVTSTSRSVDKPGRRPRATSGSPAKHPLSTHVLVDFRPVNSLAIANDLEIRTLGRSRLGKPP